MRIRPTALFSCGLVALLLQVPPEPMAPSALATAAVDKAQHAIGYDADATRPPRSALPDGLRVPAGMRVAGGVFHRADGAGWSAQLIVTGRPSPSFGALLADIATVAPLGVADCATMSLAWVYRPDLPAGLTARDLRFSECWLDGWSADPGVEVTAIFDYGNSSLGPTPGGPPPPVAVSAVTLSAWPAAGRDGDPLPTALPRVGQRNAHALAVPAAGDVTGVGFVGSPLRVLAGSQAVAAPLGGMGAFHQVLRVSGRPAVVFTRYVRRLRIRTGGGAGAGVRTDRGRSAYGRWRTAVIDAGLDERNARLSMVTRGRRTYLDVWAD